VVFRGLAGVVLSYINEVRIWFLVLWFWCFHVALLGV
jgi:hypothetical protein